MYIGFVNFVEEMCVCVGNVRVEGCIPLQINSNIRPLTRIILCPFSLFSLSPIYVSFKFKVFLNATKSLIMVC